MQALLELKKRVGSFLTDPYKVSESVCPYFKHADAGY